MADGTRTCPHCHKEAAVNGLIWFCFHCHTTGVQRLERPLEPSDG